jgi:pyruvate/2-oxoglutarate dehydrogenase complex dihydrolipoamide acyltransferase (E2) component
MAYEFKLPDLGEGLTEGEVARWLVSEGQEVAEDEPLVEIQTDKTTVEIPSPAAGKVARILVGEGEVVPVGTVLVVIGEDGAVAAAEPAMSQGQSPGHGQKEQASERAVSQGQSPGHVEKEQVSERAVSQGQSPGHVRKGRVRATPLVRRVAQELGVDLGGVTGTGPQGRITEEDVRAAAGTAEPGEPQEGRREPLRGVRRLIAEHMARAHQEVPPVTWVEECDLTEVDLKQLVALTLKAVALSLQDFPELNARLEDGEIVYLDRYDLGVAVQTEQGLVVPVVRGCDERPVEELADEVSRLADAARAGKLEPSELRGSTFTVTSAGRLGGLFQTPIVNHPEVAILSIGRVAPRAAVRDGEVTVREIGYVSITFDHRVVDGARAAEFGLAVIDRLQRGVS